MKLLVISNLIVFGIIVYLAAVLANLIVGS